MLRTKEFASNVSYLEALSMLQLCVTCVHIERDNVTGCHVCFH
jgi:hypothetical protein